MACCGLASPSVATVPVESGPLSADTGSEVEAELDLEGAFGLAPDAHVVVYEGPASTGSVSRQPPTTTCAAAGDEGSQDCYGESEGSAGRVLAVDDPASQPFVTPRSAERLSTPGGTPQESVWDASLLTGSPGGGRGGVSDLREM
ncbi:MAG: hypothetical protein ACYCXY_13045, partial [Acidimicrobiales bacterium]